MALPVENGTVPTVPSFPPAPAPTTSGEGSPKEAGASHAVATGAGARVGVNGWVEALGVIGVVVMVG